MGASRAAGWLILVAGCNLAWGIKKVPEPDAAIPLTCEMLTSHDEDGDGHLDGCDVCPGIPDDQTDSDHDGVGDACDPDPATAQHIAWFESFAESGAMQAWNPTGTWGFIQDSAVYSDLDNGITGWLEAVTRPAPPYTVEVGLTIDGLNPSGCLLQLFGDKAVQCGIIRHSATPGDDWVRLSDSEAGGTNMEVRLPLPGLHATQRLRVTMTYDPSSHAACAVSDRDTGTTSRATLSYTPVMTTTFGIRDTAVGAHIEYIAVYAPVP